MGQNPGSAGFAMPDGEDAIVRKIKDLERTVRENAAARSLEAASIGAGGITVKDGGSITVEAPGTIDLLGGAFAAASVAASGAVTGATVTATGTVQGATVVATGNATVAGNISVAGPIYSPHGRANPVTTNYVSAWLNVDGRIGASASSVVYKQDFAPADTDKLVDALLAVSLVRFRYIDEVERVGKDAPLELGAIAEYFAATGLHEYVFNNADGDPQGINYERLTIPLIAVVQRLNAEGIERESRIAALEKRLDAAGL